MYSSGTVALLKGLARSFMRIEYDVQVGAIFVIAQTVLIGHAVRHELWNLLVLQ